MKNPGVFSSRVLLDSLCSFKLHSVSNWTLTSWNTIRWCKTAWPGLCLEAHCGFQQWMSYSFHHKSYCTVFSDCCQPLNDFFFQSYLCLAAKLVAGDRFELPMLRAYETGVVATLPALISYSYLSIVKHTTVRPQCPKRPGSQNTVQ